MPCACGAHKHHIFSFNRAFITQTSILKISLYRTSKGGGQEACSVDNKFEFELNSR